MLDKKAASSFVVLQTVKRSGTKFIPNYLWDNYEYVIGGEKGNKKKNDAFISMINTIKGIVPQNKNIIAISNFYKKYSNIEEVIKTDSLAEELIKSKKNISFLLNGEMKISAEDKEIQDTVLSQNATKDLSRTCLVTGKDDCIARLHTTIKLTKDTGPLVSFQTSSGYDSYGKQRGYNAPISEEAEFAYTTALNTMLGKDSHNKFRVGNRTFLFWASSKDEAAQQAEESLFDLLGFSEDQVDDPNAKIEQVRKVFKAINSGYLETNLDDRFYILGLAPNSARIAVVYWSETSLKDFAGMILKHFEDMNIVGSERENRPYMGIRNILSEVTRHNNDGTWSKNITPNLPEAVIKSIFQGFPYPYTLLSACIRRLRAECSDKGGIRIGRIAILKAYLNRINDNNNKIDVRLDKNNTNQDYLCGRLFAVLDKIQEDTNDVNSIREHYMNAASSTPASVFATILNLSSHHLENLSNIGQKINFEKIKQEIFSKISANGFPTHLDLQDQGRFFVGYYHQRQDFFTKKEENNDRINDNNKKIEAMLDKDNTNQGYLCGRLFAVLDRIQEDANNINSIRERYMNAASSTPASVFATILNLSSHHSENLSNEGKKVFYEKIKQEIIDKISADGFPAHLDLQDQGRFFVGYYHQKQDFFTKKEENNN